MEGVQVSKDLLDEAIELARPTLEQGGYVVPLIILDRAGDRRVERFLDGGVSKAKARFGEILRTPSDETCVLVYQGRVGHDGQNEPAILIEHGVAGGGTAMVFAQRFRARKGRFRRFKLVGGLSHKGATEPTAS